MSDQQLVNEAQELTPAQQAEAATEAVKASTELAQAAGPLLGSLVQVFTATIGSAPELFIPALTALVNSPFPMPPALKTRLRVIIANARRKAPAKAPPMPKKQTRTPRAPAIPQQAAGGFPVVPVVAGVAALGIIGAFALRKRK